MRATVIADVAGRNLDFTGPLLEVLCVGPLLFTAAIIIGFAIIRSMQRQDRPSDNKDDTQQSPKKEPQFDQLPRYPPH